MPKYYCDYCDIFLTHDSLSARKAHNVGWKHKIQVQQFYSELDAESVQQVIDSISEAYQAKGLGGFPELLMTRTGNLPNGAISVIDMPSDDILQRVALINRLNRLNPVDAGMNMFMMTNANGMPVFQ